MFPLIGIIFPLLRKNVSIDTNMFSLVKNAFPIPETIVFIGKLL